MRPLACASLAAAALIGSVSVPFGVYQARTAAAAVLELARIPEEDVVACLDAYAYLVEHSSETARTDTSEETEQVRAYYSVVQAVLAVADIEKMYIPPQIDMAEGVYGNQILLERRMVDALNLSASSKVLDMGCGRGRVSHHVAQISGARVSGFNIDERQLRHARAYAEETGMAGRLDFRAGDFHKPFPYPDEAFDASYDMQAIWGFTKPRDLGFAAAEIYRTLRPGGRFFSHTYALAPAFDKGNRTHVALHALYLPTLAATQSNYGRDIAGALEEAGLEVLWSMPSVAPAWPLTDQKTALFHRLRGAASLLSSVGAVPAAWLDLIDNLLKGGVAWQQAERAKIADLGWQIVARKPISHAG